MLSFNVDVELVNDEGETMWTELIVAPVEGAETVDLKLPEDVIVHRGSIIMVKPRELVRALELALIERGENADRTPDRTAQAAHEPEPAQ